MSNPHSVEIAFARAACLTGRGRQLRAAADLSQGDIARDVGVTRATVTLWESGKRRPSGERGASYGRLLLALVEITSAGEAVAQ